MGKRSQRMKADGRGFQDHEQYALLPWEVMTSEAYRALPDYVTRVLAALAAQCRKSNNGDMCLTFKLAKQCGVQSKWKLYAALALLQLAGLIVKTRQGGMRPLGPTLYAVTWWPIVESKKYDPGINWGLQPRNTWANWQRPEDWRLIAKNIEDTQRGQGARGRARSRVAVGRRGVETELQQKHGPPVRGLLVPTGQGPLTSLTSPHRGDGYPGYRPPGDGHL